MVKNLPAMQTWVWSLGGEEPLEKGMATHSSILAWKIPWTEEPGGLQSMGLQRVGHDWAAEHAHTLSCKMNPIIGELFVTSFCFKGSSMYVATFCSYWGWIIFQYMDIPHFINLFPVDGSLFLPFNYYDNAAINIDSQVSFYVDICFHFSWIYTEESNC